MNKEKKMANVTHLNFDKKSKLFDYLKNYLGDVSKQNDYNLFVHKAYDFNEYGRIESSSRNNMKNIIVNGLNLSKYSSIQQTTVYKGDLNSNKADDILNYDYPWSVSEQVIVIVAIPTSLKINKNDIDFSTPVFSFAEYNTRKDSTKNQYTMAYDALNYTSVHKEFILGAIVTNFPNQSEENYLKNGKNYEFYINENHYSKLSEKDQLNFMQNIADRMYTTFKLDPKDDKENIEIKVMKGIIEKDKVNYNQGSYASDFDFD